MFYRFRIRHVEVLRRLAAYLSDNFCQEFIASEISRLFGISDHTAENYYSHLKEAYLLLGVPKFSYKSRERVRNENVIYVELLRRYRPKYADVFYYRDKQWEVDFIVAKDGKVEQLIQVSYDISSEKTLKREINGLVKAAEKFKCENLLLINFDEDEEVERNGHIIQLIPVTEWLVIIS